MPEHCYGVPSERNRILHELNSYRENPLSYVRKTHPELKFLTLGELALLPQYKDLINQPLLIDSLKALAAALSKYSSTTFPLSPHRVWVGIEPAENCTALALGGFHYPDLGYRYIQQISILTLAGPGLNGDLGIDPTLATLEILRGYVHDTMHYNSFRSYRTLPFQPAISEERLSFYRSQYGINFRRSNGITYSEPDRAGSQSTRNLGIIMEAAVDRFGQEFVRHLASHYSHQPVESNILGILFAECTGQLTEDHLAHLHDITNSENHERQAGYLRAMEWFHREITERYRQFLEEFDQFEAGMLHERLLTSIITGKIRSLVEYFDQQGAGKRHFVHLFKSKSY